MTPDIELDAALLETPVTDVLRPDQVIELFHGDAPLWLCRGAWELRLLVGRGKPRERIWTLGEIDNLAGVLWPANPTLGQVVEALVGAGAEP